MDRNGRVANNLTPQPAGDLIVPVSAAGNAGQITLEPPAFFQGECQLMRVLSPGMTHQEGVICRCFRPNLSLDSSPDLPLTRLHGIGRRGTIVARVPAGTGPRLRS